MGQVAEQFNIHPNTVRRWAQLGLLQAHRIGSRGDRRFNRSDVEQLYRVDYPQRDDSNRLKGEQLTRFQLGNSLLAGWITFHQTKDLLEKLVDKTFATTPVTNEEYEVLLAVKNHPGPASQVDIARWLSRSPNTISRPLARMEEKGLISRTRDTVDRRVIQ